MRFGIRFEKICDFKDYQLGVMLSSPETLRMRDDNTVCNARELYIVISLFVWQIQIGRFVK